MAPPDYFEYERRLWGVAVLPLLERAGVSLARARVLDVGCGHGGMLAALSATWPGAQCVGIDIDPEMIADAERRAGGAARFARADLFGFDDGRDRSGGGGGFDAVFLRDVLEHVPRASDAVRRALDLLRPGGVAFLSYAPFYSPFGGHQHNGVGAASWVPWLQLLPEGVFRRVVRCEGNAYKSRESLQADIDAVLATRLTLAAMRRTLATLDATVLLRERYLVRPDYRIKFSLPTVRLPARTIPLLSELLCTAEALILRKPSRNDSPAA
ncbi:MAG TPA: class I SAM-dependent methyltransferase [Gemmatimonadales bacterium]|nr:class I SAM-dependent methyltransferase [Gemmatimonadales bacterium]